ncbi:gluconokinase [Jannaschia pagri]|uniref:Gluconokinase n=1 Tax=Jannaschia pagri TaxID=2829797 RepID=A0ABQ4NM73_9RHOB|nr:MULTISPECIES: gluconokinase [unclassified Jannaschia]GIT91684.1 gluconokinase [Jannaschia sp. AI_61]GIT95518.1 gluconokinase [Jannaschia sp. AI_62]
MTRAYVVMGVSGCGKSTIAESLASAMGVPWLDGDSLHSEANIAKMERGEPLTDEDRGPWLDRVGRRLASGEARIIACSALKRAYRQRITGAAGIRVTFLFLDGAYEVLQKRMAARTGHFMPTTLLDSQLDTLERPGADEDVIRVDIDQTPEEIVAEFLDALGLKDPVRAG